MSTFVLVLLPFAAAVLPILVEPIGRTRSAWAAGAVAVAGFAIVLSYAPAVFASMITMTLGTVSADLDREGGHLLVHALDPGDPDEAVASLKSRYEAVLKEIFE